MNIYEFGIDNDKTLVMIHGACMTWDMFQESIDILKEYFHVFAVAVPGHDLTTDEEFTSVEDISERIESELLSRGLKEIDILYGLSMGGGFVIRMLADNRLHVKYTVIDAGITPYELPRLLTRLILLRDFLMAEWGKHSKKALSLAFPPDEYTQKGINYMYDVMQHMTARTIWHVFDSTDNYAIPTVFPSIDTQIEYWYGQDEKKARKLDIDYVKKHIPGVRFRELPGMDHGQYALMKPYQFAADLQQIATTGRSEGEVKSPMKANYKNWVPKGMIYGFGAVAVGLAVGAVICSMSLSNKNALLKKGSTGLLTTSAVGCGACTAWCVYAHNSFSYEGKRKLSKQIIEGTAEYINLPEDGTCLDVGTGSGALGIQVALRNPQGSVLGIDRWGAEYASFNKECCEDNALAEGAGNIRFEKGDAVHLDFPDESFDAVTSNYVYHNISGVNKQSLLRETLRVLKKGGTFAIHDIMSTARYGDMQKFVEELKAEGYEDVRLIPTDNGKFISKKEATLMMLTGSSLLVGKK